MKSTPVFKSRRVAKNGAEYWENRLKRALPPDGDTSIALPPDGDVIEDERREDDEKDPEMELLVSMAMLGGSVGNGGSGDAA